MTLGDIIKDYRIANDLSMDAFSEKSGISKAYISLLEKNKHPKTGKPISPSVQCIKQAADGMNMDFNTLFGMIDGNVLLEDASPAPTLSDIEILNPDIRRIHRAHKKMSEQERAKMMKILEASFDDYFGDDFIDEDDD